MNGRPSPVPGWFIAIVVMMLLPLLTWPRLVGDMLESNAATDGNSTMLFIFPIYALLSEWLAYRCYASRREVSWILLGVLMIAYVAMFFLMPTPLGTPIGAYE